MIRKKLEVVDAQGKIVGKFSKQEELDKFLKQKRREQLEQIFRKEWVDDQIQFIRGNRVQEFIEKEMQTLGKSPEKAEGGIEEVYAGVKKRLKTEYVGKELKKEKKRKEQLETIEREFEKRGIDPRKFMEDAIHRKGQLENLKGNWEEDKDNIKKFFEDRGIVVMPETLEKYKEKMGKKGEGYEKKVGKETGFMEWLLNLLFFLILEPLKPKEKREK